MNHNVKPKYYHRRIVLFVVMAIVGAVLIFLFTNGIIDQFRQPAEVTFGATFSPSYATSLGLDWRAAYTATLDDLKVRKLRIPAYWENIEPRRGEYYWTDLDWMLAEAKKRNATVLLAIGFKLPRWPECHAPAWVHELPTIDRQAATMTLLRTIVTRYQNNETIWGWQVENEPLFADFGNCPEPDREFLKREVGLVRALDTRPIVVTESGELSTWLRTVYISDILGISMYRETWNQYLGYLYYPLSPGFYRQRSEAVKPFTKHIMVTELQVEPWVVTGILGTPVDEQLTHMNRERLSQNIDFVRQAGFRDVYLWGIEWWYWMKEAQNDSSLWEAGKTIFHQ